MMLKVLSVLLLLFAFTMNAAHADTPSAKYLLLSPAKGNLPNSRAFTPGANTYVDDAGAQNAYTLDNLKRSVNSGTGTILLSSSPSPNFTVLDVDATSATCTVQLPQASTVGDSKVFIIKRISTNANGVSVVRRSSSSDTIDGSASALSLAPYEVLFVQSDGVGIWHVLGKYRTVTPIAEGGTGTATAPSANGQILIGASGGTYVPATITQGAGITITNAANSITIANSQVQKEVLVKRTTSDDTRTSNVTKAVASGLTTALKASTTYDFVATMFCTVATATPDLKCSFTGPSGSTVTWAALSSNALGTVGATASGVDGVVQLPNDGAVVSMSGTVTTTTAGNITFEWAQNTSNANTLTLRTGSNITFTER